MLKTLRRKLRKSRTPSPENVQFGLSKQEMEREMALTAELRKTLSTFQSCKRDATSRLIWTMLLPVELIYLIIDTYYSDDLETLRALAGTCKVLYFYCRQYIHRTVVVSPHNSIVVNDPSFPERFARTVVQAPHILDHIQKFRITMRTRSRRAKFDPLNREEESIAFLLARRMKNLRQLKITLRVDWILLPDSLQDAVVTSFQSPALNDVTIEGIQSFPLNLFLHIKSLECLDFRCDAAPPSNQDEPSLTVQPKVIHLHNPRASTLRYLFGERSSLRTSQLCSFSLFGNGRVVSTLDAYLPSFSLSLTHLELDPGPLGGGAHSMDFFFSLKPRTYAGHIVPVVPDLSHLPILKYLTLTVDMLVSLSGTLTGEATPRWQWVIDTLNTCYQPSTIRDIHIVVHTNSPKQPQVYDWRALDSVFAVAGNSWTVLEALDISICAKFDFHRGYLGTHFFDQFLPGEMVNLVRKGVSLRGRYCPRSFHGQLAQRRLYDYDL